MSQRSTRRGQTAEPTPETPATEAPVEETTVTDEAPQTEQVEATPEATPTEPKDAPKAPEAPQDLGPFQAAVALAATQADESTGMLPEDALKGPNEEYSKLTGAKNKGAAKKWLGERMQALLMEGIEDPEKVNEARAYMHVQNGLTSTKGGSSEPKAPADPTADFVAQVATLRLALEIVEGKVPEGVNEDWNAQVSVKRDALAESVVTYQTWLDAVPAEGEEKSAAPETDAIVTRAFRLAQGKAPGKASKSAGTGTRHTGPSRSVEKHIESFSADKPVGTFAKIAEIANHNSPEYGDDHPSSGAVSAALFGKDGEAKVKGGMKGSTQDGKRGAVKVAA
jgi:hypothetical protein